MIDDTIYSYILAKVNSNGMLMEIKMETKIEYKIFKTQTVGTKYGKSI